jgi:predicted ribosomally synthesized peptide with nif11-like leader
MAIQDALAFLRDARLDERLGAELDALEDNGTLEPLVRAAAGAGHDFTAEELERAFRIDWSMRLGRYSRSPKA